ncbi:hypothetical protein STEG23_036674, partial [Scotinomys teguina]
MEAVTRQRERKQNVTAVPRDMILSVAELDSNLQVLHTLQWNRTSGKPIDIIGIMTWKITGFPSKYREAEEKEGEQEEGEGKTKPDKQGNGSKQGPAIPTWFLSNDFLCFFKLSAGTACDHCKEER